MPLTWNIFCSRSPEKWPAKSNYTGQQIKKKIICDEYVINLFVCIYEVRKGT